MRTRSVCRLSSTRRAASTVISADKTLQVTCTAATQGLNTIAYDGFVLLMLHRTPHFELIDDASFQARANASAMKQQVTEAEVVVANTEVAQTMMQRVRF